MTFEMDEDEVAVIISQLPYDDQVEAITDFLLCGQFYYEVIRRPHVLPEYRLVRTEKVELV